VLDGFFVVDRVKKKLNFNENFFFVGPAAKLDTAELHVQDAD
jgi:hypothetical protein